MELLNKFLNAFENIVFKDNTTEIELLKKVLPLSVYWDNVIHKDELTVAISFIETKLRTLNYDEMKIDLIINDFKDILESYKADHKIFIKDKQWLYQKLKENEIPDEYLEIIQEIFKADGIIDEKEKNALDNINKFTDKGETNEF